MTSVRFLSPAVPAVSGVLAVLLMSIHLAPVLRPLRPVLTAWHRRWAASPVRAERYARLLVKTRRHLPERVASMVLSNLQTVDWPAVDLPAIPVQVSPNATVRLHPHFGEFDAQALVRERLQYETEVFAWLESRRTTYDTVVEIGANVGVFTIYFGTQFRTVAGAGTRVLAFEPSPEAFRRLQANLRANNLSHVVATQAAVSDTSGTVTFHEPAGHLTNGSLLPSFASQFSSDVRVTTVRSVSGADIAALAPQGRVLLKLDVEGAEAMVLRSLSGWLMTVQPDILIEVLPGHESEIQLALPDARYRPFEITPAGLVPREVIVAGACRDWWLEPRARG